MVRSCHNVKWQMRKEKKKEEESVLMVEINKLPRLFSAWTLLLLCFFFLDFILLSHLFSFFTDEDVLLHFPAKRKVTVVEGR